MFVNNLLILLNVFIKIKVDWCVIIFIIYFYFDCEIKSKEK